MVTKVKDKLKVLKKLKNGSKLFNNGMVVTPIGRAMFVNYETPKENEDDDGNKKSLFSHAICFPKGTDLSLVKEACTRFAVSEKGEKGKRYKNPLRPQDDKIDDYEGFMEGGFFMNNSSKFKPRVTGRQKEDIEHSDFYSGCWVRATLRPYLYDAKGNRGVGLGLAAIQFIKDDERIGGGGVNPDDVFDEEEGDYVDDSAGDDEEENEFL